MPSPASDAAWAAALPQGDGFTIIPDPERWDLPPGLPYGEGTTRYGVTWAHQYHCVVSAIHFLYRSPSSFFLLPLPTLLHSLANPFPLPTLPVPPLFRPPFRPARESRIKTQHKVFIPPLTRAVVDAPRLLLHHPLQLHFLLPLFTLSHQHTPQNRPHLPRGRKTMASSPLSGLSLSNDYVYDGYDD